MTVPTLGVSVAVFQDRRLLLARRGHAPFNGLWSLPGGSIETGETPLEAAQRELREETGLSIGDLGFVETFDPGARGGIQLSVFVGHLPRSARPVAGDDAVELTWRAIDDLHTLETTPGLAAVAERAWRKLAGHA